MSQAIAPPPEPHTAKRQRLSAQVRRQLILTHAKVVFAQHGYFAASTGMLALASGVSEPMLYKHFGSKKGLFMAVLEQFIDRFIGDWQQRIEQRAQEDLLAALTELPRSYHEAVTADPDAPKLILQGIAASADDSDFGAVVYQYQARVYQVIYSLLERAQQARLIDRDVNLHAATWGYMSTVLAIQFGQMIQSPPLPEQEQEMIREWSAQMVRGAGQLWLRALRSHTE